MEDLSYRTATRSDLSRVAEIHRTAVTEIGRRFYTDRQVDAWAAEATKDAYPLDDDATVVLLAERDSDIVGVGQLNVDTPEIAKLFVAPEHAGEGLGARLLEELERYARDRGIDELFLDASLNATDFYHRNGYTYGEMLNKQLPAGDGSVVYPTLRMYKTLG